MTDNKLDQEIDNILNETSDIDAGGNDVEASAVLKPTAAAKTAGKPRAKSSGRVSVIVDEGSDDDPSDVFLSVNGKAYQVQRGVKVDLPPEILEAMDNARTSQLVKTGNGEYKLRDRPRFTYRRL